MDFDTQFVLEIVVNSYWSLKPPSAESLRVSVACSQGRAWLLVAADCPPLAARGPPLAARWPECGTGAAARAVAASGPMLHSLPPRKTTPVRRAATLPPWWVGGHLPTWANGRHELSNTKEILLRRRCCVWCNSEATTPPLAWRWLSA